MILTTVSMMPAAAYAFMIGGAIFAVAGLVLLICKHPIAGVIFLFIGIFAFVYGITGGFTGNIG